jgi:hypothetical protein
MIFERREQAPLLIVLHAPIARSALPRPANCKDGMFDRQSISLQFALFIS